MFSLRKPAETTLSQAGIRPMSNSRSYSKETLRQLRQASVRDLPTLESGKVTSKVEAIAEVGAEEVGEEGKLHLGEADQLHLSGRAQDSPVEDEQVLAWEQELMQRGAGSSTKDPPLPEASQTAQKPTTKTRPAPETFLLGLKRQIKELEEAHLKSEREVLKLQQEAKAVAQDITTLQEKLVVANTAFDEVEKLNAFANNLVSAMKQRLDVTIKALQRLSNVFREKRAHLWQTPQTTSLPAVVRRKISEVQGSLSFALDKFTNQLEPSKVIDEFTSFKRSHPALYRQTFLEDSLPEILLPYVAWHICQCAQLDNSSFEGLTWLGKLQDTTRRKVVIKILVPFCEEALRSWWEPVYFKETDAIVGLLSIVLDSNLEQDQVSHLWHTSLQAIGRTAVDLASRVEGSSDVKPEVASILALGLLNTVVKLETKFPSKFRIELEAAAQRIVEVYRKACPGDPFSSAQPYLHGLSSSSFACVRELVTA